MKRPLFIWLAFAACVAVGLGVLGWFSSEMLRLDRIAGDAQRLAAREEAIRLALWRMDSALAGVHGLEAARPSQDFEPFHALDLAYSRQLSPLPARAIWAPSPLLQYTPPFVHLHFRIDAAGSLASPQAPPPEFRAAAAAAGVSNERIQEAAAGLARLNGLIAPARLHALATGRERGDDGALAVERERPEGRPAGAPPKAAPEPMAFSAPRELAEQKAKSFTEERQRQELYVTQNRLNAASALRAREAAGSSADSFPGSLGSAREAAPSPAAQAEDSAAPASAIADAAPRSIWAGGELFLVRESRGEGGTMVEGAWLDWPEIEAWLLSRVSDLLPGARLMPAESGGGPALTANGSRRLAFLPVALIPGPLEIGERAAWSPLRVSLGAAWASALVGAAALALLLRGTLKLSERRGAFVSAVTHELRTPLTTFRLYTEMLSSGMVADESRRQSYIDTLRKESERLAHLVENVLGYSRIERGRAASRVEETTPADLVARMADRLRERLAQGNLTLTIDIDETVAGRVFRADTTAVEQVLFNLVDNATKYGRPTTAGGDGGTVTLSVAPHGRNRLAFRVADPGPGLPPGALKRLFQPFSKSAHEAAESQPGVGLGLALCRRLAREELGGDLVLERNGPGGTVFRLEAALG